MSINLHVQSATSFSPATCLPSVVCTKDGWRGSLASLLATRVARNKNKNMQNEPNLKNDQMRVTAYYRSAYGNFLTFFRPKNEPKRTQNEPNFSPKLALFFQYWLCFPQFFQSFFTCLQIECILRSRLKSIKKQNYGR